MGLSSVVALLYGLAVVSAALGGFATIAGLGSLRERCFTAALLFVLGALALPLLQTALTQLFTSASSPIGPLGLSLSPVAAASVVAGHGTLAVALGRRYVRRASGAERRGSDLESARGRGRPRLSPDGQEDQS
jgi:hypothetical protein